MKAYILRLILIISLSSCQKDKSIHESEPKILEYKFNGSEINILVRDTVFANKDYKCLITYKHPKDSLKKHINGKNFRNLFFNFTYTDTLVEDIKKIKSQLKDTIFSITDNNEMYSEHIRFKKTGVNYIDGIIQDDIYLMLADSSNYRLISDKFRLNFKVFVVDSLTAFGLD